MFECLRSIASMRTVLARIFAYRVLGSYYYTETSFSKPIIIRIGLGALNLWIILQGPASNAPN